MSRAVGSCVDIFEGGEVCVTLLLSDEGKSKLRLLTGRGREVKVADNRVINVTGKTLDTGADPAHNAKLLQAFEDELQSGAAAIDLAALWEVLADEGGAYSLDELADLACGSRDGTARATVLRRLMREELYFTRKKFDFAPRSREELGETVKRRRVEEQRTEERAEFFRAAKERLGGGPAATLETSAASRRFLDVLRSVATFGGDSDRLKEGLSLLEELGHGSRTDPDIAAVELLVKLGVLDRDVNLMLERHGVELEFSSEVMAETEKIGPTGHEFPSRRDLRDLRCFAIDDPSTTEVDDAISLETLGDGRFRFGVHIADPSPYIAHDGVIDLSARGRATTFYLPEQRILMLPARLSEGVASLVAGEPRPALSFLFEVDGSGQSYGCAIVESVVRVEARLGYDVADTLIALGGGAPRLEEPPEGFEVRVPTASERAALPRLQPGVEVILAQAARIARGMLEHRARNGALILKAPDIEIKVVDGLPMIRRLEPWTPSWTLVSEAMVLANTEGGRLLRDRRVPGIFRRQAPPERTLEVPRVYDPAASSAVRRQIRPTEIANQAGRHAGLGVDAYVQCSSPLRRYQDLACHRQIKAALAGSAPPFDREAMQRVSATSEVAEKSARAIERGRREYWILRWLEMQPSETVFDAVVLRTEDRRTVVEIGLLLYQGSIQPRPEHAPGRQLQIVVDVVEPRAARLRLRER